MNKIRCLIADIPQHLLVEIIRKTTESQTDIDVDVIEQRELGKDLVDLITEESVDTLLLGMEKDFDIRSLDKIFDVLPQVVVVGIIDDGRRVCLSMEDVGPELLMKLVRIRK